MRLRWGDPAQRVEAGNEQEGLAVKTTNGILGAKVVYDTRPSGLLIDRSEILQHFRGWHIKSETPVFDPETVTLMDFDVSQEQGLHFMYVLPFQSTKHWLNRPISHRLSTIRLSMNRISRLT